MLKGEQCVAVCDQQANKKPYEAKRAVCEGWKSSLQNLRALFCSLSQEGYGCIL